MRNNLPITQREHEFPADATLMSFTDPQSHIRYANAAFLDASGFSCEELAGQPHNIVRHPDMPAEAFADMWRTLKAGLSWTGVVKNRRKNGDHYWVRANATPVMHWGQCAGYLSVRTRASPSDVAQAQALYHDLREGRGGTRRLHQGLVLHGGWQAWRSVLQRMPVHWRLRLGLLGSALPATAAAALHGDTVVVVVSAAVGLVLGGWWLEAQIAAPVRRLLAQASAVAAGQPSENVAMNRVDEIGLALRAVNQAGLNLRSLLDDVSRQIAGVSAAADEIHAGNRDLAERTTEAAASLQQVAATMEQMSTGIASNADSAKRATELAGTARQSAERGGGVVAEVVQTMGAIAQASHKIADIISVIDGIAFQTNILALNAAVEAARAGEQGKGFAVVAAEVRVLAQRSAAAAKDIKGLIEDSVRRVSSGTELADSAGQAMTDIVNQVKHVSVLIADIGGAANAQAAGIGQVNDAMASLDEVAQRNATLVEQASAATSSLHQRAERLAQAVAVFDQNGQAHSACPV